MNAAAIFRLLGIQQAQDPEARLVAEQPEEIGRAHV